MIDLLLSVSVQTSSPRLPSGWEFPCSIGFGLGIWFATAKQSLNREEKTVATNETIPGDCLPSDYEHYQAIGKKIISGFSSSERSQIVVAPSRCGKTTVMYFLLDEFFKVYPDMQCWVWQGKTIEPVHPTIPKHRHTLFQMGDEIDLTALESVFDIYKQRQAGDSNRVQVKLIINDWQSIKDGIQLNNTSLFKEVAAKIITIANNGAALNVSVVVDTQSANIEDWGLGSGSIRDNFDIYAVSRIEWVEDYPNGDVKALPKLIQNSDIVVNSNERKRLLSEFEFLKQGLEGNRINTSVLLSTIGNPRLGITPYFDRKTLVWENETIRNDEKIVSECETTSETGFSEFGETTETTPKQVLEGIAVDTPCFVSETEYTPLKLPKTTILAILQKMRNETRLGQTKIIKILWGASPGDNEAYRKAISEYQELTELTED